jgi:hypothetical protein
MTRVTAAKTGTTLLTRRRMTVRNRPDIIVTDHRSLYLLLPVTRAAKRWVAANLPDDAPRLGQSVAVEPRFVLPIVEGARADGLRVR